MYQNEQKQPQQSLFFFVLFRGSNSSLQCGLGEQSQKMKTIATPTIVETLYGKRVISVCASNDFSMALTVKGEVFVWGANPRFVLILSVHDTYYCLVGNWASATRTMSRNQQKSLR